MNKKDLLNTELAEDINYGKLFNKVKELITDQVEVGKDGEETSLLEIETSKAKTNNFMDALSALSNIKHEIDIISSSKNSFKRADELEILNDLRLQCALHAKVGLAISSHVSEKVLKTLASENFDPIEISTMQQILDSSISTTVNTVSATEKLIQLERKSGNRQYGVRKTSGNSITYIQALDQREKHNDFIVSAAESYYNSRKPRQLTQEETERFGKNNKLS